MAKITVSLPPELLNDIDEIVGRRRYSNRSEFIREAVRSLLRKEVLRR